MKEILLMVFFRTQPADCTGWKGHFTEDEALPDFPGKDVQILTSGYPPGGHGRVHGHNAHAFSCVLEGSIVMAVNGGQPVTLTAGRTLYDGPNHIRTISHNPSKTAPTKFLVFLLQDKDAFVLIPVK